MTYQYQCSNTDCGYKFDFDHGMRESPLVMCPKCGYTCIKIITGGVGFIFKGSGFYATDYRKKGK